MEKKAAEGLFKLTQAKKKREEFHVLRKTENRIDAENQLYEKWMELFEVVFTKRKNCTFELNQASNIGQLVDNLILTGMEETFSTLRKVACRKEPLALLLKDKETAIDNSQPNTAETSKDVSVVDFKLILREKWHGLFIEAIDGKGNPYSWEEILDVEHLLLNNVAQRFKQ